MNSELHQTLSTFFVAFLNFFLNSNLLQDLEVLAVIMLVFSLMSHKGLQNPVP